MLSRTIGFAIRLAASLMLAGIGVYALAGTSGSVSNGTVVGTVERVAGQAVLPYTRAQLIFSGKKGEYQTDVDGDGRYKISLPAPDLYSVKINFFNCTLTRAAFHLKPGGNLEFRFVGVICPTYEPSTFDIPLQRNKLLPPEIPPLCTFADEFPVWYREQRFERDPSHDRPEVVISFGRCEESGKGVRYFSLDPSLLLGAAPKTKGDLSLLVALTTEAFTVRADNVTWLSKEFTFYASGNVTVEDGRGHVTYAESATLSFTKGHPVIKTEN